MFPKIVVSPKWMVYKGNLIKMDDLGGKPTIFGNIHIYTLYSGYFLGISPFGREVQQLRGCYPPSPRVYHHFRYLQLAIQVTYPAALQDEDLMQLEALVVNQSQPSIGCHLHTGYSPEHPLECLRSWFFGGAWRWWRWWWWWWWW